MSEYVEFNVKIIPNGSMFDAVLIVEPSERNPLKLAFAGFALDEVIARIAAQIRARSDPAS